jgi:hypothetical protein
MQRMSRLTWMIALAALVASLGFAAVALADTEKSGSTAEGVAVKLVVADPGNATSFTISSSNVNCKHGTLNTGKITYGPFDVSDPGSFHDKSNDNGRQGAIKFKSKTRLTGSVEGDGITWSGTYARTTKVFKHGDKLDTCRQNTTWTAA